MAASHITVQDYAGVTVATIVESSMLNAREIDELAREVYALIDEQNKRKLVLDFTNIKLLSSQMIGVLLNMRKKSDAAKGELVLCGLRPELMKLFRITNLEKTFKFFKDDAEALAHFGVNVP